MNASQKFLNKLLCNADHRGIVVAPDGDDPAHCLVSDCHILFAFDAGELPPLFRVGTYSVLDGQVVEFGSPEEVLLKMWTLVPSFELRDVTPGARVILHMFGSFPQRIVLLRAGERHVTLAERYVDMVSAFGLQMWANEANPDVILLREFTGRIRGLLMACRFDGETAGDVERAVAEFLPGLAAQGAGGA